MARSSAWLPGGRAEAGPGGSSRNQRRVHHELAGGLDDGAGGRGHAALHGGRRGGSARHSPISMPTTKATVTLTAVPPADGGPRRHGRRRRRPGAGRPRGRARPSVPGRRRNRRAAPARPRRSTGRPGRRGRSSLPPADDAPDFAELAVAVGVGVPEILGERGDVALGATLPTWGADEQVSNESGIADTSGFPALQPATEAAIRMTMTRRVIGTAPASARGPGPRARRPRQGHSRSGRGRLRWPWRAWPRRRTSAAWRR